MINEPFSSVAPDLIAVEPSSAASDYLAFVRTGDAQALDRALNASVKQAYTQAYRRLGNAADADDAVQEAFLQLVRSAERFDGSIPFHIWLALMVKTACLRLLRSDRRRRVREGKAMIPAEQSPAADHPLNEELRAKIALLSPADSTVIELHYFAGLSQAEVAAAVGTSENAISLRLSRARNRLRKLFGGKITAAGVVTLLATQQSYAASPQALTGIASLTKSVALGQTLPAHVIPLTFTEKALMFMSLNPISTCACAVVLLVGGLTPIFLPAAEAQPPAPVVATTSPTSSTPPSATASSEGKPWAGKAKDLLPFMNPQAPFRMAIDWQYLRQMAPNTQVTSAFSDERSKKAVAYIAKQLESYAQGDTAMPDFFKLTTESDGLVMGVDGFSGSPDSPNLAMDVMMSIREAEAKKLVELAMYEWGARQDERAKKIGPYDIWQSASKDFTFAQSGGQFFMSQTQRIQAGLTRKVAAPPTAPIHVFLDGKNAISVLTQLTEKHGDVLELDTLLGSQWRHSQPTISIDGTAKDGLWQTNARIRGTLNVPLRAASPAIAGCITPGNLASLVVGCDIKQALVWMRLILGDKNLQRMMTSLHVDEATLVQCLTGDIACMVRQGPVFPEGTLVLGLHEKTADKLAGKLGAFFTQTGLQTVGSDVTRWEGMTPAGKLAVQFSDNRLVIHLGNDEPKLANETATSPDVLAVDIDLRTMSRSYLPLLMNLVPAPADAVQFDGPLTWVIKDLMGEYGIDSDAKVKVKKLDAILRKDKYLGKYWERVVGPEAGKSLERHMSVFIPGDKADQSADQCDFVFRTPAGWKVITAKRNGWSVSMLGKDYGNLAEVRSALQGYRQIGGVAIADLGVINLPDRASFDRRWLPPLAALLDHMPVYRLRAQKTDDGYAAVENGLPVGIIAGALGLAQLIVTPDVVPRQHIWKDDWLQVGDLQRAFMETLANKRANDLAAKYQQAITAVRQVTEGMEKRKPTDPILLTASSAFAATGVPLTALAVFTDNVPPTPAQVDALGFWHPSEAYSFEWLVPIENDLFIEFSPGRGRDGFQVTAIPGVELQRALSAEELERFMQINEERKEGPNRRKPKGQEKKPDPEDFNSF